MFLLVALGVLASSASIGDWAQLGVTLLLFMVSRVLKAPEVNVNVNVATCLKPVY